MKNVLLGITGGIAAYKGAELIRLLRQVGCNVRVILTEGGKAFVTPLTLQALSEHRVYDNLLDPEQEASMSHIALSRWADAIVIAPASANTLATLAAGHATDLLSTLCLAASAPIYLAPAMNHQMWHAPATTDNMARLMERGYHIIGPNAGEQACGEFGLGRMVEPEEILSTLQQARTLDEINVLITAGPTWEPIDPVRHLGNRSSGKMGYALAVSAQRAGAKVTLISGPTQLHSPPGIKRIDINTAAELQTAVNEQLANCQIFISAAAVADYRPITTHHQKMKKTADQLTITLERTPDILGTIHQLPMVNKPYLVGFAAETENLRANALKKLTTKKCDMIIANDVSQKESGFGSDFNSALILTKDGEISLENQRKSQLANQLIATIAEHYRAPSFARV